MYINPSIVFLFVVKCSHFRRTVFLSIHIVCHIYILYTNNKHNCLTVANKFFFVSHNTDSPREKRNDLFHHHDDLADEQLYRIVTEWEEQQVRDGDLSDSQLLHYVQEMEEEESKRTDAGQSKIIRSKFIQLDVQHFFINTVI